jgi:hypothetical protein
LPSWSYRNLFEWLVGAGGGPAMSASGSFVMSGTAQLQTFQTFDAEGVFVLSGEATLDTSITMAAAGLMELIGEASLRTGKRVGILSGCGGPLAADCEEWVLKPFQRVE